MLPRRWRARVEALEGRIDVSAVPYEGRAEMGHVVEVVGLSASILAVPRSGTCCSQRSILPSTLRLRPR